MTKTRFLSLIAVAGLAVAAAAHAAPATPAMIAEVQAALDKGDAQHAASLADAALKEEGVAAGERGRLLLYRGLARELLGVHAEAMRDFTQALGTSALPPDEREQALLQRGFLRDGLGQLEAAAADYSAVILLKGDSLATAFNNRANIYRRQNKLADARRDYVAALSAQGGKPQYSYYGLGQIAEAQHDTVAARGFYAKAVAADSSYGLASERLTALGGPPDGAIPDPVLVVLHPPPAGKPAEPERGFKVAAEVAKETDSNIVLRAPRPRDDGASASLHPAPPPRLPTRDVRPSRFTIVGGLILRPALDQHGATLSGGVQLGAWRSEAEANAGWDQARVRAGGVLDGLSPYVVAGDLPGKGRYYRLRVGPERGRSPAELCASLTAKGVTCLSARD